MTLEDALASGKVTEATVTRSAGRVLLQMQRFGMLDGRRSYQMTRRTIADNARIIEHTAEEAAVLLKNANGALPLRTDQLNSVVLIGPTAGQVDAIGIAGERSLGLPQRQVSPLTSLRWLSGNPNIRYAVDDDMTGSPIPAANFSHDGEPGLERNGSGGLRSDPKVDFTTMAGTALPPDSTATWTGSLQVEHAGVYWFYLQALGTNARLYIDGKRVAITGASTSIHSRRIHFTLHQTSFNGNYGLMFGAPAIRDCLGYYLLAFAGKWSGRWESKISL